MAEVTVQPTEYTVSLLPLDHRDAHLFKLTVEWRGEDRWAVCNGSFCLGTDGDWDWEARPSDREDEWLATHRFELDAALDLARAAAPGVEVNGWTAQQVLERR